MSRILAPLLLILGVSTNALAAGSVEAGQSKSVTCAACHGPDGNSVNPEWPSIAGQHQSYLQSQLTAFRDGARQNALMSPQAMNLSDEDIADLAAYYAAQASKGGTTNPELAALGERLYQARPVTGLRAAATRRQITRRSRVSTRPILPPSCALTRQGSANQT